VTSAGTSVGTEDPTSVALAPDKSHRWRAVLVIAIVVVALAEVFVRAIGSHLPSPLMWESYETQRKVQEIDALSQRGGAQVVFVGSSIIDVGIDPASVDRQIGGRVISFNAGLASSIPRMTAVWAEHVVIPRLHPRVVVFGLNAYDLGAEDPNRSAFYNAFLGSSGAREVLGTDDPIQSVDRWLGEHSALWQHKYQLRDPATLVRAVEDHSPRVDAEAAAVDQNGRQTANQYLPYSDLTTIDMNGWTLGTPDTAAVRQLIAFDHARNIQTVLVDMPVTNQFVASMPQGNTSYEVFTDEVAIIGRKTGTKVINDASVRNDGLFFNNIHLNHNGAELLSIQLGRILKGIVG
jgi:hypothetical protein